MNTDIFIKPNKSRNNDKKQTVDKTISVNSAYFASETSLIDNNLMNIHNTMLNTEFFPSLTETEQYNSYSLTGGNTFSTSSTWNSVSMFPETETETFYSVILPEGGEEEQEEDITATTDLTPIKIKKEYKLVSSST